MNTKWHKFSDELPPYGDFVIAYHHLWVNEDFNPEGIRIGFIQDNLAEDANTCKYDFVSAHWWDYQDCYMTISKIEIEGHEQEYSEEIQQSIIPEYWIEIPKFIEQKSILSPLEMDKLVDAIKAKLHKASGEEHEIYESMAFDSHSSFGYGTRITVYALSQILGEDVVNDAIKKWLNE